MIKKIAFITMFSLLLGGCSLNSFIKQNDAVSDSKPAETPAANTSGSTQLVMPSISPNNDDTSLEQDIDNTKIEDEDFSDLN